MNPIQRRFVSSIADHLTRRFGRDLAAARMRHACETSSGEERDLYLDILSALKAPDDPTCH